MTTRAKPASSIGSLPRDVTDAARKRLAIAAALVGGVWLLYIVLFSTLWADVAVWESRVVAIVVIVVSFVLARHLYHCDRVSRVLVLGAAYEAFVCFAMALSQYYATVTWEMSPLASWTCVVILFFPVLLPAAPKIVLIDGLLAATMSPVGYLVYLALGGTGTDDVSVLVSLWLPPYLCALMAVVPAKVMHGLGTDVKKARQLGSYQLVERLGQGGMGEVWRAKHSMLVRPAAVKLIRPGAGDVERLRARFEREAQATASLQSPHTVELYDFGVSDDGAFYYVMELLRGIDLETMVRRFGPQPPARAVRLLVQACDSLDDAHRAGLVHRDIKPANIYAAHKGRRLDFVKVLDFGLVTARRDTHDVTATAEGKIVGSPAYMAPEMTTGAHPIDGRADIYCLACVAYWLLTGTTVFEADTPIAMAIAHATAAPKPPSARVAAPIPAELDRVILAALSKNPADRPGTALEFADSLEGACPANGEWSEQTARDWWSTNLPDVMSGAHSTFGAGESATAFLRPA